MKFHFEEHARQELLDVIAFYESIDPDLVARFRAEVERVISLIRQSPEAWPTFSRSTRRCRTRRFPYAIVYRIKSKEVEVLAVAHSSRRPNYWVDRFEPN